MEATDAASIVAPVFTGYPQPSSLGYFGHVKKAARTTLTAMGAAPFNVGGVLAEPILTLFFNSQSVASNHGWNSSPNAATIRETARAIGAFRLLEGSRDSALLVTLPAGGYTLQVTGANNTTGIALVEIYEVPQPQPASAVATGRFGAGANRTPR